MTKRDPQKLRRELKALIAKNTSLRYAKLRGQIEWIVRTNENHNIAAEIWALRAQLGTIQRFKELVGTSTLKNPVELVALSRSTFENLVWLKLFNKDFRYGLAFYRQLLIQQIASQEQAIEKAKDEIALFKDLDKEDAPTFEGLDHIVEKEKLSKRDGRELRRHMDKQAALVDAKARAAFSVYYEDAKFNGYGYQAHLIETKAIPHHSQRILTVQQHLDQLMDNIPSNLPAHLQRELAPRFKWNWYENAKTVGMESHYRFLYSFTSRLLHATPMSLITPKELDEAETYLLLEYLNFAVKDSYQQMEKFSYPNQINAYFVSTDGEK